MKPTLEDVLFLNSYEEADYAKESRFFSNSDPLSVTDEILEKVVLNDLNGKYYPGFLKYFQCNYQDCLNASQKNAEKSAVTRIRANDLFTKRKHNAEVHEEIWKLYSQSIAFAPIQSEELALAYGNRSYLLLHLKKYESCIKDIDMALDITQSDLLRIKLLCRKMTCFGFTNYSEKEKETLWMSINALFDKVDVSLKDERIVKIVKGAKIDLCKQSLDTKQNGNGVTENMSHVSQSKVSVAYKKKKVGRHFRSNQDFATGDIVAITKPVVTTVNLNKFYAYCSHCLSLMWAGIPCDECSLCMYCSQSCKLEAWEKYHDVECKILPHLNMDNTIFYHFQIPVRAIIMGLKEMGSISQLMNKTQEIDSWKDNTWKIQNSTTFDSDFLNLYSLPWITSRFKDFGFLLRRSKNACFLMAYLTQTCDIFEMNAKSMKVKELVENDNFVFLTKLMLKLLISSAVNAEYVQTLSIQKFPCNKYSSTDECTQNRCCLRGMYIDPFERSLKNDCNSNVAQCYTDEFGKILYYCTRPIKVKDEILISQFGQFFKHGRRERRREMEQVGSDYCKCVACIENWQPTDKMLTNYTCTPTSVLCAEDDLAEKYIKKHSYAYILVQDVNAQLSRKQLQELAEDTNKVVESCGQPSFLSSTMLTLLIIAFERANGAYPLVLPAEC